MNLIAKLPCPLASGVHVARISVRQKSPRSYSAQIPIYLLILQDLKVFYFDFGDSWSCLRLAKPDLYP